MARRNFVSERRTRPPHGIVPRGPSNGLLFGTFASEQLGVQICCRAVA